ncbi:hypothetical protein, partial [Nonomuraea guangzhouensis]|uniref:hypothetical protein n=1 Tax=Nonomuraea guangzhouensis TaxID=1291555 RepID=UPI001C5E4E05
VRGGHLYVIPSDAKPLIAKGLLDRRLFDVTQLLQWGYGDATRGPSSNDVGNNGYASQRPTFQAVPEGPQGSSDLHIR